MTDFTTAAQAAKQALEAKLNERCVRCGAIRRDGGFCRDDHNHRFLPADHWMQKS